MEQDLKEKKEEWRELKRASSEALNRTIGQRLVKARIAIGLRPTDVCAAFPHLSKSHLSEWENGQKQIPTYWLRELSRHYDVSLDYIVGDINDCEEVRSSFEIRRTIINASQKYLHQLAQELGEVASKQAFLVQTQDNSIEIAKNVCQAFNRMKEINPELWESVRGGVRVESMMERFLKSLKSVDAVKRKIKANYDLQTHENYMIQKNNELMPQLFLDDMFTSAEEWSERPEI
ncbi:helix-turn-helix transcriptional regulator [Neisseriaceae bacterium ESL0693]|nr:helix-turn-helix transcriptional regulator [Neisseriaceae bacterium ESL0693]